MAKISLMSSRLANMIAAGEVIERPSSVIKELVENSIDAKAKHIEVSIENAGKKLICVKDDGEGMDKEDATLCFKRHASSKLIDEYQLFKIKTMGFRGEALPSIASVSKVTLYTSNGKDVGSKVFAFEDQVERSDYQLVKGTIFEVRDLFYNTPVRLKYLKTDYTEIASCLEIMQRLALSYPSIAFDFFVDNKLSFSTTGRGDLLEVIARLYGSETAKKMIPINLESLEYQVKGYISKPELTRASKYYMITILNHRNVYLPKVQKALIDAYKDFIFSSQYPFCILDINVEPTLVDVNVHPSKKEVRLSNEEILFSLVQNGIKKVLEKTSTFHEVEIKQKQKEVETVSLLNEETKEDINIYRPRKDIEIPPFKDTLTLEDSYKENFIKEKNVEHKIEGVNIKKQEEKVEQNKPKENNIPNWKIIGQIMNTYIILEGQDGFYLMDQHAAMERINYEKYQNLYNEHYDIVEPLFPLTFEVSLSEKRKFTKDKQKALKEIGIEIDEFGPTSFRVISYPTFIDEKNHQEDYLRSIFNDVINDSKVDIKELRRHVIATMACKASIKANDKLTPLEMESLYKRLFTCENPTCCPHGRPTIIHFSKYDIEKLFKRSGI